jgi:hypothetical protein
MRTSRPMLCAAEWIIPDTESVDALVEAALCEQAWWIALRCGKHAHRGVVWADGHRRTSGQPSRKLDCSILVQAAVEEG